MKIKNKLLLSFALVSLICLVVGVTGWYGISHTSEALRIVGELNLPEIQALGQIKEYANAIKAAERTMINPLISAKDREQQFALLKKNWTELEAVWSKYDSGEKSPEDQVLAQEINTTMTTWKTGNQQMAAKAGVIGANAETAGNAPVFHELQSQSMGSGRDAFNAFDAALNKIIAQSRQEADSGREQARLVASRSIAWAIAVMIFGVGAALALGYAVAQQITTPLRQAIQALEKISLGDTSIAATLPLGLAVDCSKHKNCGKKDCPSFGKEDHCWVTSGSMAVIKHCPRAAKGEDCRSCALFGAKTETEELGSIINSMANSQKERAAMAMAIADGDLSRQVEIASDQDGLGKALEHMQQSLLALIGQTKLAGEEIASGALQIADSSQSMAQGASEQASSLEEISSAMTEISSQTKMTADHANRAQELSHSASSAAIAGNQQMQEMVEAMEEIRMASQSVANVIKVIEEIAFQTNMLALNAAVEAAHAGQHGKGFAVVAEEVRNLAARSAKAAKETADLIAGSVDKTENGAKIADKTAASLMEITNRIGQASELVQGIAEAAREQSQGIDQVSQGLHQIDNVTQQNSAHAEEGAAASEELSGQAAQLNQLMQNFKVADHSQGGIRQLGQ